MNITIPEYVRAVMDALEAAGHRGYLVGGSLRDLLRGVVPHDYDLTTDATPDEMIGIFRDFHTIPTGIAHGTLTVMSEHHPIEVTTHRVDGAYTDARHPEEVSFSRRLSDDLARRDFTVNAMAYHPEVGLADLFDGRGDLARGVLRAVGDAETRFTEDALRILRGFRFAAQLRFEIERETLAGAMRAAEGLAKISAERITAELCRLLECPDAQRALELLLGAGCGKYVFFDTVQGVKPISFEGLPVDAALRLAAILPHADVEEARALCKRLKTSNAFLTDVCGYLAASRAPLPVSVYEARVFLLKHWHHWQGGLAIKVVNGVDIGEVEALCRRLSRDGSVVEIRRLAVNGKELQDALGVRGAQTGALLARLQDMVLREDVENKRAALMAAAEKICAADAAKDSV